MRMADAEVAAAGVLATPAIGLAQDSSATVPSGSALAFRDFWGLVEQAGPLRWPIFAVLAIGLALALHKAYALFRDRRLSAELFALDVTGLDLGQITARLTAQHESMLAGLMATMLNVHRTGSGESTLHDEIANFVSFHKDQFERFRRRMDFLSDTAGALGLLGTVWGMFEVFFQGTPDRETILRGMGIALMTTLLGLVVSITLNLATTELFTYFGARLEFASKRADLLRFRLLELAAKVTDSSEAPRPRTVDASLAPSAPARRASSAPATESPASERMVTPAATTNAAASGTGGASDGWCEVEAPSSPIRLSAGELARGIELRVRGPGDQVPKGVSVRVVGARGGGGNALVEADEVLVPDASGTVRFDWAAPPVAGAYELEAMIVGHSGPRRRIALRVAPAAPAAASSEGNHQAAIAGMRLARPLAVRVEDRFGNAVGGVPVKFRVSAGAGRLGSQGTDAELPTGPDGVASISFAVGSDAGSNRVVATVPGVSAPIEFTAFGTAL
ncbi:MAG: MotA/TolQ/ExbB proton channel family protein [Gemmatimonadaceae bacterium]